VQGAPQPARGKPGRRRPWALPLHWPGVRRGVVPGYPSFRKIRRRVCHHPEALQHRPAAAPPQVDIVTLDLSFISVLKVLPAVAGAMRPEGAQLVVLIKPQFEAGKGMVSAGGVVRDPKVGAGGRARAGWTGGRAAGRRARRRPRFPRSGGHVPRCLPLSLAPCPRPRPPQPPPPDSGPRNLHPEPQTYTPAPHRCTRR
jgi:hypothetical protein